MVTLKKYLCVLLILNFSYLCAQVRLTHFETSTCKGDIPEGIVFNEVKKDELKIIYAAEDNCCLKFKGKIDYAKDTLYLIRTGSGEPCRCLCKYEYTYIVKGITNVNPVIKYKKE